MFHGTGYENEGKCNRWKYSKPVYRAKARSGEKGLGGVLSLKRLKI
jgi:hypothetical protein